MTAQHKLRSSYTLAAALLSLLSLSHHFPLGIHALELLSAFAHFTGLLATITLIVSVYYSRWLLASSAALSVVLCSVLVLPHFSNLHTADNHLFSVGHFNLYHGNTQPQQAFTNLEQTKPDVLVVQELNDRWMPIVDTLIKINYPFYIEEPWHNCCYGIGLYSKFPILESEVFDIENTPAIRARIDVNGNEIEVLTFHTRPPFYPNETAQRNSQLKHMAQLTNTIKLPVVVLGDWNVVPWNKQFQQFINTSQLTVVQDGFRPTFPMDIGIPLIPIDYITYANGLTPTAYQTICVTGADHKGIVASFALE